MTTDERSENFFTKCEPCIFKAYSPKSILGEEEWKQSGCGLGRLKIFQAQDKVQLDNGHYVIKGVCNTCRGESWAQQNNHFNLITKVYDEIRISLDFILTSLDNTKKDVVGDLAELVSQCLAQKQIKPKQIILVIKNKNIDYNELFNIIRELCGDIKFNIVRIVDQEADVHTCIEMGVQKSRSRYYAVFGDQERIPTNLITTLNEIINQQLKSLSMVRPYDGYNGLILQRMLHRIFGGNRVMPIYEKIEDAATIQNSQANLYTWEELWKTPE